MQKEASLCEFRILNRCSFHLRRGASGKRRCVRTMPIITCRYSVNYVTNAEVKTDEMKQRYIIILAIKYSINFTTRSSFNALFQLNF
jgi:hypothetical protein